MTWFTSSTSNRPQYAEKVSMAAIFCAVVGGTFHFGRSAPVNSTHMCPSAVYIKYPVPRGPTSWGANSRPLTFPQWIPISRCLQTEHAHWEFHEFARRSDLSLTAQLRIERW